MYSGGICSWTTAMRVKEWHPGEEIVLLFADTRQEDKDLYRFLDDSAKQLGLPLIKIADGRTPWEVFEDERFIGNSRIDPCSKILKRQLLATWMWRHRSMMNTVQHFGLDWTEHHRLEIQRKHQVPWRIQAYMTEPPYLSKQQMISWAVSEGLTPPRLYRLGFSHNNCGGFCIKAGQAQFALLLRTMPKRYAFHEQKELELRAKGINGTILTLSRDGIKYAVTLKEFREMIETGQDFDREDWGGCGCALEHD